MRTHFGEISPISSQSPSDSKIAPSSFDRIPIFKKRKLKETQKNKFWINKDVTYMEDLIFRVEESLEGGYTARGLDISIYTQGDTLELLKFAVIDAVHCHYDYTKRRIVRLQIVREEIIDA